MTTHAFAESLEASHAQADAPWWEQVYQHAFGPRVTMLDVRDDGWAQRGGIDRQLHLPDGTVLKVDEKVRGKDWGDIALERWSDRDRRKPGWIQKKLTCDFIAYAFVPSQVCYLLPFHTLRRAWRRHGQEWIDAAEYGLVQQARGGRHEGRDGFYVVWADNGHYVTENIAVPTQVLLDAIRDAMTIRWRN